MTPSQGPNSCRASPEPETLASQTTLSAAASFAAQALHAEHAAQESSGSAQSQAGKRKLDEALGASFTITSPSEIVLPKDPVRRASIINLATAAAAAVLQGKDAQRRFSLQQEQQFKRQRIQQLGFIAEQARMARSGRASSVSDSKTLATAVANALLGGKTAACTASHSPATGPSASQTQTSPKASRKPFIAPPMPSPRSSVSGAPSMSFPAAALAAKHRQEWEATVTKEGFLDEAKMVANQYGRFYRFEQEWAKKVLAYEANQNSTDEDMPEHDVRRASDPTDTLATSSDEQEEHVIFGRDRSLSTPSNKQATQANDSQNSSRAHSRAQSPLSLSLAVEKADEASSSKTTSPPGSKRPSQGLVTVLSNFAELLEARQQVCSGLEALADRAKDLPMANTNLASTLSRKSSSVPVEASSSDSDSDDMSSSGSEIADSPDSGERLSTLSTEDQSTSMSDSPSVSDSGTGSLQVDEDASSSETVQEADVGEVPQIEDTPQAE